MKQSSVEWFIEKITDVGFLWVHEYDNPELTQYIEQAKAIHEQEMIDFANWCRIHDSSHPNEVWTIDQLWDKYHNNTSL